MKLRLNITLNLKLNIFRQKKKKLITFSKEIKLCKNSSAVVLTETLQTVQRINDFSVCKQNIQSGKCLLMKMYF